MINTRLGYQSPETKVSARCRTRGKNDIKYQKNDIKYQSPQTDNTNGSCTSQGLSIISLFGYKQPQLSGCYIEQAENASFLEALTI